MSVERCKFNKKILGSMPRPPLACLRAFGATPAGWHRDPPAHAVHFYHIPAASPLSTHFFPEHSTTLSALPSTHHPILSWYR